MLPLLFQLLTPVVCIAAALVVRGLAVRLTLFVLPIGGPEPVVVPAKFPDEGKLSVVVRLLLAQPAVNRLGGEDGHGGFQVSIGVLP